MWGKRYLHRGTQVLIILTMMAVIIGFSDREQGNDICKDVIIKIDNQYQNFFIDDTDITALMTDHGEQVIKGAHFNDLSLKTIEERVRKEPFIKSAEIYKDLKGNILVQATLRRPLARVIQSDGPDAYIAMDGTVLSVMDKYTTRVTLVSGAFTKELLKTNLYETEEGRKVMKMLNFINEDKFWKAQVAQVEIDKDLDITLYPQITKQLVEFGTPDEIEGKFKKLKIFYERILPQKGWNTYEKVNLKYKNQIIAD